MIALRGRSDFTEKRNCLFIRKGREAIVSSTITLPLLLLHIKIE